MSNIFLISDTHFGHEAACTTFKRTDGTPLRPFASARECDEATAERWNATVRPNDKVYHLGDLTMSHKYLTILHRLNGEKVLIKGNHDTEGINKYLNYFKDVRGSHNLDKFILTHIPVHPLSLSRWEANIHGHLHSNRVPYTNKHKVTFDDPRYFCVCVEQINFTPISLEDVKSNIIKNLNQYKDSM